MQHHMSVYLETYRLYIYNKLRKLIDKMLWEESTINTWLQ